MLIGIGCTVPEIVNLPGQSGEEVEVVLNYSSASVCNNNNAFSPSQATPSGGVFSAPAGLNINSSTGEVTPVGSTPQLYVITYTVGSSTSTFDLTIKPLDNATFSYSASSFPQDGSNPSPVFPSGAITGGTFSAGSGLVFVDSGSNTGSSSGQINLSASTIGSYTITYNTASSGSSVCPNTSNVSLAVGAAALAQVNNVYSMAFDGTNDFISINNSSETLNVDFISVSAWFYPTSFKNSVSIISTPNRGSGYHSYNISTTSNGSLRVILYTGANFDQTFTSAGTLNLNQWNFICMTYDGTNVKVTLNTASQSIAVAANATGPLQYTVNPTGNIEIGRRNGFSSLLITGNLDEVGVWNTTLTQAQVTAIYNATEIVSGVNKTADLNALTTPPIKWYRMGD